MEIVRKYYKNSNTGLLCRQVTYICSHYTNIHYYYEKPDDHGDNHVEDEFDLTGYVEIKEKTYNLWKEGRGNYKWFYYNLNKND